MMNGSAVARTQPLEVEQARRPLNRDLLPSMPPSPLTSADTLWYGYFTQTSGEKYAVAGEQWTFDHGSADPMEGFYAVDLSLSSSARDFRRVTASIWTAHQNWVAAPVLSGSASLWIGAHRDEADANCWSAKTGYGNNWDQEVVSAPLAYAGSGAVMLSFVYFNDSEAGFDYTRVGLLFDGGERLPLNGSGFTDKIGSAESQSYSSFAITIPEDALVGHASLQLLFEFTSNGIWSDEDGLYDSNSGPFAVDDITVGGALVGGDVTWNFESGDEGFTPIVRVPVTQAGIAPSAAYPATATCGCGISGNVLELHAADGSHPVGQHEAVVSPIVNRGALGPSYNAALAEWDQYSELPQANGVFYRPTWMYWPFVCLETGVSQWSGFVGEPVFYFVGSDPVCWRFNDVAGDDGVPGDASLMRFVYELYSSCDAFGIPPTQCTGITNYTPLLDNLRIGVTQKIAAPPLTFLSGGQFIDGFPQSFYLASTATGNADIAYDLHRSDPGPDRLGDSLVVRGPIPTSSSKYEAKMWWRVRREGPGQSSTAYNTWKAQVSDGLNIVGASGKFTFGQMDSVQLGSTPIRWEYISEFREQDDDFAGESADANEMIRDGILTPGTQIQYFITANFACTPTLYSFLPDTSGGNFLDFEILPSYRMDAGVAKFPCLLYINAAANAGSPNLCRPRTVIEQALNLKLNGRALGDEVPNPTSWDRYDYLDAASNWHGSLLRAAGGNNGTNLVQLLNYRAVVLNTGSLSTWCMDTPDFELLDDWLTGNYCNGNTNRQAFIANGDHIATVLNSRHPSMLYNTFGAVLECGGYGRDGCGPALGDLSDCVQVRDANVPSYPAPLAWDAWGNGCLQTFDVIGLPDAQTVTGSVANRVYYDQDGAPPTETHNAQVVRSVTGSQTPNYRAVLDGVSYDHMMRRDPGGACLPTFQDIVDAARGELGAAIDWAFSPSTLPGLCTLACVYADAPSEGADLGSPVVSALLRAVPNPFNPRASIHYSLAERQSVAIEVFDVAGRKVRTLVDAVQDRGPHVVVWEGNDDRGVALPQGVYWAAMKTPGYESSRKLIRLR